MARVVDLVAENVAQRVQLNLLQFQADVGGVRRGDRSWKENSI